MFLYLIHFWYYCFYIHSDFLKFPVFYIGSEHFAESFQGSDVTLKAQALHSLRWSCQGSWCLGDCLTVKAALSGNKRVDSLLTLWKAHTCLTMCYGQFSASTVVPRNSGTSLCHCSQSLYHKLICKWIHFYKIFPPFGISKPHYINTKVIPFTDSCFLLKSIYRKCQVLKENTEHLVIQNKWQTMDSMLNNIRPLASKSLHVKEKR